MTKMNPAIKSEWIRRLTSGEYEQGSTYLRNTRDRYCCLGILCEMAAEQGVVERTPPGGWEFGYHYGATKSCAFGLAGCNCGSGEVEHAETTSLPKSVQKWAGIDTGMGERGAGKRNLAQLNDGGFSGTEPLSFTQIAGLIKEDF